MDVSSVFVGRLCPSRMMLSRVTCGCSGVEMLELQ